MTGKDREGWRHRLAAFAGRLRGHPVDPASGARLRKPILRRYGEYTALQFMRGQTQSRMRTAEPDHLLIDYTRTMLGALLLRPQPRRIGMIGLGGGSQVKFCHRHLPGARIEAVENNAGVIALRRAFRIPHDDARLQVFHDDGARFLHARPDCYDVLLVDGYDETGIPAALSTQHFYDDCRAALAPGGAMACNLFCADHADHVARLRRSFGDACVLVVEEAKMSNRVAFAWTDDAVQAVGFDIQHAIASQPGEVRAQLATVFARVGVAMQAQSARRSEQGAC